MVKYISLSTVAAGSAVALSITLLSLPLAISPALAGPDDNAKEKLEILRKQLPEAINRGLKKSIGAGVREENVKIALFRRLSATEVKVTVVLAEESTLTFYLSYFEGAWTTTRHEERCEGFIAGREKCVIDMALAIDEIGNSK